MQIASAVSPWFDSFGLIPWQPKHLLETIPLLSFPIFLDSLHCHYLIKAGKKSKKEEVEWNDVIAIEIIVLQVLYHASLYLVPKVSLQGTFN